MNPIRDTMTATEAIEALEAKGFKATLEHTGGNVLTIFCNKNGNVPFMIGPIASLKDGAPALSTDELYWSVMEEFIMDDTGFPKDFCANPNEDIELFLDAVSNQYDQTIASGTYPDLSGRALPVSNPDDRGFAQFLPKSLA